MHRVPAERLVELLPLTGSIVQPPAVVRRWRAWRITELIPGLMEEFHSERPPSEVLDCADAVVAYYEERRGLTPRLGLARRRTRECLRAGICEMSEEGRDTSGPTEISAQAAPVTTSPLKPSGKLLLT